MGIDDALLASLRARFPGLRRTVGGRPCVLADAPAGTQVPEEVIEAMAGYLRRSNANTGGAFPTSRETDALIAGAREAGADLLGCDPDEVAFGPNATTLLFGLSRAVARDLGPRDEVVVTALDHDANIAPWLEAAAEAGAAVRWVDVREGDCALDPESLAEALSARTRVVAFTLASNAVGTVTPAAEVVRLVRERTDALIVADAVHLAPHRAVRARDLGVDALVVSPYKAFGPHLGVLFGRREVLARLRPFRVRPAPDTVPERWETGTLSHEALAGFRAAVAYLAGIGTAAAGAPPGRAGVTAGMEAIATHEAALTRRFLEGLEAVPGARLYGIRDPGRAGERVPTFALRLGDRHPRETAERLARRGVFVWDGNYYALAIMERLGLEASGGAVRVGFCHYHTPDEVDRVLEELAALGGGP